MIKIALGILATLFAAQPLAEPLADVESTKKLCDQSVRAFAEGNPKQSVTVLKPFWPLPAEELDSLAYQTQSQLKMVAERFGAPLGADFVRSERAGDSFVQHTYIGKFENHAIRYICVFYKPKDTWIVNSVYWDDQTQLLF